MDQRSEVGGRRSDGGSRTADGEERGDAWRDLQGFPLTDLEADKLRHLAIRRDVLEIGCWKARSTILMAETALSVLTVDSFAGDGYTGKANTLPEALQNIRDWDRDGKIGTIVARFETILPILDLKYFDFVFYDADHTGDATAEALTILGVGCRRDVVVAVHDYEPTSPKYRDAAAAVDRWVVKTGRVLEVVDRLAIITPGRNCGGQCLCAPRRTPTKLARVA